MDTSKASTDFTLIDTHGFKKNKKVYLELHLLAYDVLVDSFNNVSCAFLGKTSTT